MNLELFHFAQSTCSQKVRLCLAEKGLAYTSRIVDLRRREHLEDWYLSINPNGVVPALTHDGTAILDSSVICEYLDEAYPDRPLSPPTAAGRAHMRAWMRFLEEVPTTAIRVPTFNRIFRKLNAESSAEDRSAWTERMPLRKHFYREMTPDGFDDGLVAESLERLDMTIARAERQLEKTRFLSGDRLTIADLVLIPTVVRMEDLGMAERWAAMPRFSEWYGEVSRRPSFSAAYYEGSRLAAQDLWEPTGNARCESERSR